MLPSFKGAHGLKDAIDYGVKIIGATVHYVTKDLDAGHIISQAAAAISDNIESATEAIERRCEYYLYTYALNKLSKKKSIWFIFMHVFCAECTQTGMVKVSAANNMYMYSMCTIFVFE